MEILPVANPEWRRLVHASSRLTEQKPAAMARPVSVAEIGFSAVLAEGRRAFIGATDSRLASSQPSKAASLGLDINGNFGTGASCDTPSPSV
jgi:hypothetical protein